MIDPGDPRIWKEVEISDQFQFDQRAAKAERAVLVGFIRPEGEEDTLDELSRLVATAGAGEVARIYQRRESVHPGRFLSRGKLSDAGEAVRQHEADILVSDEDLSPAQVRNLEESLKVRVVDRTEIILDIFAQRARTREAKLQVELAQLRYLLPRLAGMWGHLSRTGGGIGTRGPGETQLEVDRRRVREKIAVLARRLGEIETERETQSRGRRGAFRICLVGYTNAGKSTLFNRLTRSLVLEEDKLFATLDTTTRRLRLSGSNEVLISDTVGFIRKLPHHLVASFRATLREVGTADLLLHVADASHPARQAQIQAVEDVLEELLDHEIPRILILNKADLLHGTEEEMESRITYPEAVLLSAFSDGDREMLKARLTATLRDLRVAVRVECPVERLPLLKKLARRGEFRAENHHDGRVWSELWLDRRDLGKLRRAGFRTQIVGDGAAERVWPDAGGVR